MKELVGHYVAYRKLVSPSPSELLPEDLFQLYAVCARFPHNLAGQVPWQERQAGVYDCQWGLDVVRVIVAGELPREPHNAPLHLFSASPQLFGFGRGAYRQRSEHTSRLLRQLLESCAAHAGNSRHDDAYDIQTPLTIIHACLPFLPRHLTRQVVRKACADRINWNRSSGNSSDGDGLTSLR